jgi:hypothetical protein
MQGQNNICHLDKYKRINEEETAKITWIKTLKGVQSKCHYLCTISYYIFSLIL